MILHALAVVPLGDVLRLHRQGVPGCDLSDAGVVSRHVTQHRQRRLLLDRQQAAGHPLLEFFGRPADRPTGVSLPALRYGFADEPLFADACQAAGCPDIAAPGPPGVVLDYWGRWRPSGCLR